MYRHRSKAEYQAFLNVPEDYAVDGFLAVGTHPKDKEYPHLYEALDTLGLDYAEEKIGHRFFGDVKVLNMGGKRIWFDVVYGAAYLSEVAHLACLLGSRANILLGTCGALREGLRSGDTILPSASYGNESATRMYQRDNASFLHESDAALRARIRRHLSHRATVDEGKLMTVQAMLAETKDDVDGWAREGYSGVDMESATLFAVSRHFAVPSAALLSVADHLLKDELVTDPGHEALRAQRTAIRKENYVIALKAILDL